MLSYTVAARLTKSIAVGVNLPCTTIMCAKDDLLASMWLFSNHCYVLSLCRVTVCWGAWPYTVTLCISCQEMQDDCGSLQTRLEGNYRVKDELYDSYWLRPKVKSPLCPT